LNKSQLSASQFRDLEKVSLIEAQLETYLEARAPTTSDQVHIYDIVAPDLTTAQVFKPESTTAKIFRQSQKSKVKTQTPQLRAGIWVGFP